MSFGNLTMDEQVARVERANAQRAAQHEREMKAAVRALAKETTEYILGIVRPPEPELHPHRYNPHYSASNRSGCIECNCPEDHPVHNES